MPSPDAAPLKSVGIIGTGLIGASIGMAARAKGIRCVGYDPNPEHSTEAKRRFGLDEVESFERVCQADLIVVAAPPEACPAVLDQVLTCKAGGSIVTDCASVKAPIADWDARVKSPDFVGGHPMAGHEKSGPKFATQWMFRGAKWVIMPGVSSSQAALETVSNFIKRLEASPVAVSATEHDRQVALFSHLPHVIANSLLHLSQEHASARLGAGSWGDLTRVGGVEPDLWASIMTTNRTELIAMIEALEGKFDHLKQALRTGNARELKSFISAAKKVKEAKA